MASKSSSPEAIEQENKTSKDSPTPKVITLPQRRPFIAIDRKFQSTTAPNETFESYYLRRVTAEFADDIDKVRNASDFTEKSVPVLIQALKQGAYNFSEEDKRTIMGAGK